MDLKENDVVVPLDVPKVVRENYIKNYRNDYKKQRSIDDVCRRSKGRTLK